MCVLMAGFPAVDAFLMVLDPYVLVIVIAVSGSPQMILCKHQLCKQQSDFLFQVRNIYYTFPQIAIAPSSQVCVCVCVWEVYSKV